MQAVNTFHTALLALRELEHGWKRSREGNFYMEVDCGRLSIINRHRQSGWVWGFNLYRDPDNVPALRKFEGEYQSACEAAMSARAWLSESMQKNRVSGRQPTDSVKQPGANLTKRRV